MLAPAVVFLFLASAWASEFERIPKEDPTIQVVKDLVEEANYYLEDHLLTEIKLPDIGAPWPADVVTLTDGKLGEFNSLQLEGEPEIQQRNNTDGSTTYLFDVKMGLEHLAINYQFKVKFIGFIVKHGTVDLVPARNTIGAKGIVVVRKDGLCDAGLYSVSVDQLEHIRVVIRPQTIPGLSLISETILHFVTPKITLVTNIALNGFALSQTFQAGFSKFVCKEISHPTEVPPTDEPTEKPTEEPTEKPTEGPTETPTEGPTETPTEGPTEKPTEVPTEAPTEGPTEAPTEGPTEAPTEGPTEAPTEGPTEAPTEVPTEAPTEGPTEAPTEGPTEAPKEEPTEPPTDAPADVPSTPNTNEVPTDAPADVPSTPNTNELPTDAPADVPSTPNTNEVPTDAPDDEPSTPMFLLEINIG